MNFSVFFSVMVVIFLIALLRKNNKTQQPQPDSAQFDPATLPYHSKYILTSSEYKFYLALKSITDLQSYIICPKIGLKDLFVVNTEVRDYKRYWSKISQKHLDFLVCDSSLHPLFAIELDDKSHSREDVKMRDQFKDALFHSAGLPLYRVPCANAYSDEYIRRYVRSLSSLC